MLKLWKHQEGGLKRALEQNSFALFFEVGTGKSAVAVHAIRHRCHQNGRLLKALILAPKAVLYNWKNEFKLHSKIDQKDILILDQKSIKARAHKLVTETREFKDSKIVIANYDAMKKDGELLAAFSAYGFDLLVCDESHRLKNHESKRAKEVVKLADTVKYKYILTGTPILNTPMDIYMQYRVLDGGETFGKNFWAFRGQWFQDTNSAWSGRAHYFPKWEPRPTTFKELTNKIYNKAMRAVKAECLDLPPLIKEVAYVDLSPEQARLYRDMKNEFIAYVDDLKNSGQPRAVVAQLAVTKALRLQQIISGHAKLDSGEIYEIKENPRLGILKDYLEEITGENKVIVWATFHENYRAIAKICEQEKIGFVQYHGLVSGVDREKNLSMFRKDPQCRVMIANQASGGIGINMTEASYSIFYSRNFSLEQDLQAEARNYRGGSEMHTKVTRIDLIAKGTIDELISEALLAKKNISDLILDWKDIL